MHFLEEDAGQAGPGGDRARQASFALSVAFLSQGPQKALPNPRHLTPFLCKRPRNLSEDCPDSGTPQILVLHPERHFVQCRLKTRSLRTSRCRPPGTEAPAEAGGGPLAELGTAPTCVHGPRGRRVGMPGAWQKVKIQLSCQRDSRTCPTSCHWPCPQDAVALLTLQPRHVQSLACAMPPRPMV